MATRIGGHVVAESLRGLGAEVVFGLPGVHALPIWEGLRSTDLRVLGFRQELNAAFAADGYARVTRKPTPLLVSTGPGAFMTLGALMEAFTAFVPVVVVSSQIRSDALGQGRGELHETPDQMASFAPLVKWTGRASSTNEIPAVLADAWRRAQTPPCGPVYVEVPYDVLRAPAEANACDLDGVPQPLALPERAELDRAAALLAGAERPLIVAGGGVVRSDAGAELLELAVRLDAPVATTYTGKGAVPEAHPLAVGSAWDDTAHRELVAESDVVLVVGSWLGYELADTFRGFAGIVIQIDAALERIGIASPALGLVGDAKAALEQLLARAEPAPARVGEARAAAVRAAVGRVLDAQSPSTAIDVLRAVEDVVPEGAAAAWDSTILAYTACWYLRARAPHEFLYPAGSSTLGYAWPAALGAAAALPTAPPALAIAGDGGFQYGIADLATARQNDLDVTLLLIDDGGYGILREYQDEAGFAHTGVDLDHPDFAAVFDAYEIPVRRSEKERLRDDLAWALEERGPSAVILQDVLRMPVPSALADP
jgi:acetolactate synthase-1/2/3 large subunit